MIKFFIFIVGFLSSINGYVIPFDAACINGSKEICYINHSQDNCHFTAAYPYKCVTRNQLYNCDLVFNWKITNNIIDFSLTKYNYRLNEWIGIIFAKESIKSDIVIGVIPDQTDKSKIINGIIDGYDVILDEDSQPSSFIFNKKYIFSERTVEFKFSRNLTNNNLNENSIDFTDCLSNENGIGMYLLNGSLSQTGNVLFNSSSSPKSIGPFCFNSCSSKPDENTLTVDVELNTNEGRNFAFNSETSTALNDLNDLTDTTSSMISTDSSTVIINTSTNNDALTTSSQTQESLEPITARSNPEFTSEESTTQTLITSTVDELTTNALTSTLATTLESTTEPFELTTEEITTNEATTSTTTITTTSTKAITTSSLECPSQDLFTNPLIDQTNNAYQFKMDQFYDKTTDTVNYTIVILNPESFSRFSVHAVSSNEAFVIYGDFNTAQDQLETFTNLTESFNSNSFQFSLPRTFSFANGLVISDCATFKIYHSKTSSSSKNISMRSDDFLKDISQNKYNGMVVTNQVCLNTCCSAPKSLTESYFQMNILNRDWTDDYNNVSLPAAELLSNQIRTMIDNQFSTENSCLVVDAFELISIRKKSNSIRRKRIVASDSILVTAKLKLLSSISDTLARETLQRNLDLLASNQAQSIIFNRPIVSANSPETTTTQASIMSTTATPQTSVILSTSLSALSNTTALSAQVDDNYSAKLAIALSLSLLATLIIMGGALFGFLYWRKAKLNQSGSSSQNHSILRSLGNRFSGSGYKQPNVVKLDGIPPNNYTNDDFELQNYDNETFEQNEGYHQFTDFSGSREVGIDVGPFDDNINYTNPVDNNPVIFKKMIPNEEPIQEEEPAKFSHLLGIAGEAIVANNRYQEPTNINPLNVSENVLNTEKASAQFQNYDANHSDIEIDTNQDQKEMSREEFDDLFDKRFSEILGDKSFEKLLDKKGENTENAADERDKVEISKETHMDGNMFNNIEQNFPELFGEIQKETQKKYNYEIENVIEDKSPECIISTDTKSPKGFKPAMRRSEDRSDISSIEMESTEDENAPDADSLQENLKKEAMFEDGISLSLKSDDDYEDDYRAIEVNAIKSLKINNEDNSFVMTNQTTTFKQLIMANRDQESSGDEEQHDSLSDSLEGDSQQLQIKDDRKNIEFSDTDNENDGKDKTFVNSLMQENDFSIGIPNPRSCRISVANVESGLGIHLCGTKNHMIKNIEQDSPAEVGGLKPGDKILVINKENVEDADYTTVVDRLKDSLANNQDIDLLVMNIIEYNLFKQQNPILQNLDKSIEAFKSETDQNKPQANKIFTSESDTPNNEQNDEEDEETKSSNSSDFNIKKNADIENFVNSEFNPFHDVPNEMFSPFLHYSSIPPPEDFQAEGSEKFFTLDQDPFSDQFESLNKSDRLNPNPTNNLFDDTNSDAISENSTNSSNNLKNDPKLNDFFPTATISEMNLVTNDASNFDEQFLKNYPSKPAKNLSELIMTKSTDNGKLIQSQEFNNDLNITGSVTSNQYDFKS